ncbi:MAG: DUF6268 family outer membrane beta-barrel protein [Saprospiraceae bacterium]
MLIHSWLWSQEVALQTTAELKADGNGRSYFCVPGIDNQSRSRGVEIFYNVASGGVIQRRGDSEDQRKLAQMESTENISFKLYIPLLLKRDFKILLGYAYQPERFRYGNLSNELQPLVANFQGQLLKSNSYSVLTTKSLDHDNYIAFRAKVAFNGDYKTWMNFDQRYMTMNAIGLYGIKKNADFEWGVGVYFSKNMRRTLVLPFAMMHKNFNDKWGIELAPPAYVYGRYNINPKSILLFGSEFNSRIYSIDTQRLTASSNVPNEYTMNHQEVSAMVSLERQLMPWVWLNIKGGYQFNIGSRFEPSAANDPELRVKLPQAPFFQMGIFLSPPDHMK